MEYFSILEEQEHLYNLGVKKRNLSNKKEKKLLWNIVKESVKPYEFITLKGFLTFLVTPYLNEILEIYDEKNAIEKIKPYLIKYIRWRLWNPENGLRYFKLKNNWYNRINKLTIIS